MNEQNNELIIEKSLVFKRLIQEVKKVVVGQDELIRNLIIALLSSWHIILEWVPGLAKTLSIQTLSQALDLDFSRIQFTPDLLPSDLIGTQIYNPNKWEFTNKLWPIFANFVLADEINRAPSKVQSALLQAMAEQKVTIWENTYWLKSPFIVLATQNPLEQEGTYPLPEAQLDRFLFKTIVKYPTKEQEIEIMKMSTKSSFPQINKVVWLNELIELQDLVKQIYVSDNIYNYVRDIVFVSRNPKEYGLNDLHNYIMFWASPRSSIWLILAAKALAFMNGRSFVVPEDVKSIALDVMRHRIILSYEALASDVTTDDVIKTILDNTKVS